MAETGSRWPAPAKLNLFLHVVGQRADGYHLLQTVFQLLDWGDEVELRARADGAITRRGDLAQIPEGIDLTLRAANLLRRRCPGREGAEIAVDKRIPVGGGLGGGSSDAATVLVALNEIWRCGLGVDELADLGAGLGADVPVFVRGHTAWAEGIGERLAPIDVPARHYVIVDPGVGVATASLFQAAELTRNSPPTTISDFLAGTMTTNAFAPLVRARHPRIAAALDWLGHFGDARLSGSGGCVFVALESAVAADAVVASCPAGFTAWRAAGIARSPLLDAVARWRKAHAAASRTQAPLDA
jgi:4-diphosphocytidyl-2-C-methyl-D-erythritol kinase